MMKDGEAGILLMKLTNFYHRLRSEKYRIILNQDGIMKFPC